MVIYAYILCYIILYHLTSLEKKWDKSNQFTFRYYDWGLMQLLSELPSGDVKIAIENGHRNSEFSH